MLGISPYETYKILLKRFGPQGWWPVSSGGIYPKYRKNFYGKLNSKEMFEVCVGALLTQNTSWKNVESSIVNLNRQKLIYPEKITVSGEKELANNIRSCGYYNQKAKKLKNISYFILNKYSYDLGFMRKTAVKTLRPQLLSVNGVGPETADSILLYAFGKKIFVVDAYTMRFSIRMGFFKACSYNDAQGYYMSKIENSYKVFNEYHALIVELCKTYCKSKAKCSGCPLEGKCNKNGV